MTGTHHQIGIFYTGQLTDWPSYVNDNGAKKSNQLKRLALWALIAAAVAAVWSYL